MKLHVMLIITSMKVLGKRNAQYSRFHSCLCAFNLVYYRHLMLSFKIYKELFKHANYCFGVQNLINWHQICKNKVIHHVSKNACLR